MGVKRPRVFQPLDILTSRFFRPGCISIVSIYSFTATRVACTPSSKQCQLRCSSYLLSFYRELMEKVFSGLQPEITGPGAKRRRGGGGGGVFPPSR